MREYKTIQSSQYLVFDEKPDSDILHKKGNVYEQYFISEIIETNGLFLCHSNGIVYMPKETVFVTNPDYPVAKFRMGEKVIISETVTYIDKCMPTKSSFKYSVWRPVDGSVAWFDESKIVKYDNL